MTTNIENESTKDITPNKIFIKKSSEISSEKNLLTNPNHTIHISNGSTSIFLFDLPCDFRLYFSQFLATEICSISEIKKNLLWIGTNSGFIFILEVTKNSNVNDSQTVKCNVVNNFVAHKSKILLLLNIESNIWSISSDGETCVWEENSYTKTMYFKDDFPFSKSFQLKIKNSWQIWSVIENPNEIAIRVWNTTVIKIFINFLSIHLINFLYFKDTSKVSKIILVPPKDTDNLKINSIVNIENFVYIALGKWIYIYDGISYQALFFWQAHDDNIKSLATFDGKLWSFCDSHDDVRLWIVNMDKSKKITLKQMPLRNLYSSSSLVRLVNINDTMWCFYEDCNLSVINSNLKLLYSAKWIEGSAITNITFNDNRILILCDNKLLIGLERP